MNSSKSEPSVESMVERLETEAALCRSETADDIAALLEEATVALREAECLDAATARTNIAMKRALLGIAKMGGRKLGVERAKSCLYDLGINWETGEALPDYSTMT